MSKSRLFLSLAAIVGLLILAGGVGSWAFPLRAPARSVDQPTAEDSAPPATAFLQPVTRVNPIYPVEAKKTGIEGKVLLRAIIAKDGSISNLKVLRGDPQLAKAATDAVRQWHYAPLGKAVISDVTINFTLAKGGATPPSVASEEESLQLAKITPQPISKVRPVYPVAAKRAGLEGAVVLRAIIAKDGSVSNLKVLSGDPQLAKAAMDAVRQWRYAPMERAVISDVTLHFTLAK